MAKSLSDLFPDLDERGIAARVDEYMKEHKRVEEEGKEALSGCLWIIFMAFLGSIIGYAYGGTSQYAAKGYVCGFLGTWGVLAARNVIRRYRKGTL